MSQNVAIVDYGMGNLRSVQNAVVSVANAADKIVLSNDPEQLRQADRIIFPGQGAAKDCMHALRQTGMQQVVLELAKSKPFLGICMGLQVLMSHSDENGGTDCISLYPGRVRHFSDVHKPDSSLKIPHMGWNNVRQTRAHPMWKNITDESMFYFVHSYFVQPEKSALTIAESTYGIDFTAAIAVDNIFAMQCHPEKSAASGLQLLRNFLQWDGD